MQTKLPKKLPKKLHNFFVFYLFYCTTIAGLNGSAARALG